MKNALGRNYAVPRQHHQPSWLPEQRRDYQVIEYAYPAAQLASLCQNATNIQKELQEFELKGHKAVDRYDSR